MSRRSTKSPFHDWLVGLPWWAAIAIPACVWVFLTKALPSMSRSPAAIVWSAQAQTFTLLIAMVCFAGWAAGLSRQLMLRSVTSLEKLRALNWREFEQLVAEAYRRQGWSVSENWKDGADGGVDLDLKRGSQRLVVQCKQWRTRQVPVTKVRELWGVASSEKVTGAVFVTCGGYTRDALDFARDKPLELVDGDGVLRLIGAGTAAAMVEQTRVERVAVACPTCGAEMVRRLARKGPKAGSAFLGCTRYPGCKGTREVE